MLDNGVNAFTVEWDVFNPLDGASLPFQQLGGYIGTGDQSNYIKVVAQTLANGESGITILFEDDDAVVHVETIEVPGLFDVDQGSLIYFSFDVDRLAETITPIISFEDEFGGARTRITGETFSISDSNTLDAINQDLDGRVF